jgi:hypothetical protein
MPAASSFNPFKIQKKENPTLGRDPPYQTIQYSFHPTPDFRHISYTTYSTKQHIQEYSINQSLQLYANPSSKKPVPCYTKQKPLRRKKQRQRKRESSKIIQLYNKKLNNRINQKIQNISNMYGFTSDPNKTITQNFNTAIQYISQSYNNINDQ